MAFLKASVCVKKNSQNHHNKMAFTQYTKKLKQETVVTLYLLFELVCFKRVGDNSVFYFSLA